MKIKLNPNEEIVKNVREALAENDGYCPCSLLRTEDTKCMCKEFKNSEEEGTCHCGLYIKEK